MHKRASDPKLHRELGITVYLLHTIKLEAMTLAQRDVVMNAGVMEQFGTPEKVYNRLRHFRDQLYQLCNEFIEGCTRRRMASSSASGRKGIWILLTTVGHCGLMQLSC